MDQNINIIAPLFIDDVEICMAMISHKVLHLFDRYGNNLDRKSVNLPSTIFLSFKEKDNRQFRLAQPNTENDNGVLYVINKNNDVIFSPSNGNASTYCRLADNAFLLGCSIIDIESNVLANNSSKGVLIYNDSLTNYLLVGNMGPYFLFKANDVYTLFAKDQEYELDEEANKYEYDEDNWKYKSVSEELIHVQDFETNFVILWKTEGPMRSYNRVTAIYPSSIEDNTLELLSLDGISYDYNSIKRTFHINSNLSNIDWEKNIQILTDAHSIVIHHTSISSDYAGFTIIIDYDGSNHKFALRNKKRLGKYYNDRIEKYSNSLILFSDYYGSTVYNMDGDVIIKPSNEYDYHSRRAAITDYAIFGRKMGEPWIRTEIHNNHTRYGVLRMNNLKVVVPPNYNKIDYLVLEEPSSKHYRNPGEYEIFIKCCIECPNEDEKGIEYWGMFKDSKLILPCNNLGIDLFRVKKFNFILITNLNNLKGIYFNNALVIPSTYQNIKDVGNYLILERPDGKIDITYTYAPGIIVCQCDSFEQPKVSLKFLKNEYVCEDAIIVTKDGKFGLIDHGELVCQCLYDKISIENVNPNYTSSFNNGTGLTNPIWFKIQLGEQMGLYSNHGKRMEYILTEIIYSNVKVLDWKISNTQLNSNPTREFVIMLDNTYYTKDLLPIGLSNSMVFRGFLTNYILVFSNKKGDSVEFISATGKKRDYFLVDAEGDFIEDDAVKDIPLNSLYAICRSSYSKHADLNNEELVFSFGDNKIVDNPFFKDEADDEDVIDYDFDEDYDYECDTYYALGGDDYDSFKENGGSIDNMMEDMGL
ncbi:MAG: hypothetical protein HDR85_03515 [Bacteroides sp.]|nr:hypothetical protein [Bacteroides sp.]